MIHRLAQFLRTAGMYTFTCHRCDKSLGAGRGERNEWTQYGVAITKEGKVYMGYYDDYGHLLGKEASEAFRRGPYEQYKIVAKYEIDWKEPNGDTIYHYACWVAARRPRKWRGTSPSHQDWGSAPKFPLKNRVDGIPPAFRKPELDLKKIKPMGPVEPLDEVPRRALGSLDTNKIYEHIQKIISEEAKAFGFDDVRFKNDRRLKMITMGKKRGLLGERIVEVAAFEQFALLIKGELEIKVCFAGWVAGRTVTFKHTPAWGRWEIWNDKVKSKKSTKALELLGKRVLKRLDLVDKPFFVEKALI